MGFGGLSFAHVASDRNNLFHEEIIMKFIALVLTFASLNAFAGGYMPYGSCQLPESGLELKGQKVIDASAGAGLVFELYLKTADGQSHTIHCWNGASICALLENQDNQDDPNAQYVEIKGMESDNCTVELLRPFTQAPSEQLQKQTRQLWNESEVAK